MLGDNACDGTLVLWSVMFRYGNFDFNCTALHVSIPLHIHILLAVVYSILTSEKFYFCRIFGT